MITLNTMLPSIMAGNLGRIQVGHMCRFQLFVLMSYGTFPMQLISVLFMSDCCMILESNLVTVIATVVVWVLFVFVQMTN